MMPNDIRIVQRHLEWVGGDHSGMNDSYYALRNLLNFLSTHNGSIIPEITDPVGQHWKQPPRDKIRIFPDFAMMTLQDFKLLSEYNCSIPSGTYVGKMWKYWNGQEYFLRWYERNEDTPLGMLDIKSRRILVI